MKMGFEFPEQEQIKKETLMIEKDWEDTKLPESFEALVCETTLKSTNDDTAAFEGLNVAVGVQKIPGEVKMGAKFKIYRVVDLSTEGIPANGIVKIQNLSTGEISNTETWRSKQEGNFDHIAKAA